MDERISAEEAAELLGVGKRHLNRLVSTGVLRWYPAEGPRKFRQYKTEEVLILKDLREKDLDFPAVASLAMQAVLQVRSMEKSIKQLLIATGLNFPILDLSKEGIVSLCLQMEEAATSQVTINSIWEWAKTFHGIGEETLSAIELHTGNVEPWQPILMLGRKLMKDSPKLLSAGQPEVQYAYQILERGMRNARASCFFYVQMRHGRSSALELFPDAAGDTHELLTSLAAVIFK